MTAWLILLWFASAGPTAGAAAPAQSALLGASEPAAQESRAALPKALTPGRYRCVISGILCEACTRAILRELRGVDGLSESRFEEDNPVLWLTVAKTKTIRVDRLERALRAASQRIDLATKYVFVEIRYRP